MTLTHTYPMTFVSQSEIINLSISGKKILLLNYSSGLHPDTLFFYNLDYSFWKQIICPLHPGYNTPAPNIYDNLALGPVSVYYPSETLFNTDSLLEVAILYPCATSGCNYSSLFIINENSMFTDSIQNITTGYASFRVFQTSPDVFKATVTTINGTYIYDLPVTIPCNICGNGLGLAKTEEKPINILSSPIPNPSKDEVKITFTLPEGASRGELTIYDANGQKIKSYVVDNRFGFIIVDNRLFAPGMYYYNLTVNGVVSSTQKMVVIK